MLKPQEMARAIILGTKDYSEKTVEILHNTNSIHINTFTSENETFKIGAPAQKATELSEKLLKLRSATRIIDLSELPEAKHGKEKISKNLDRLIEDIDIRIKTRLEEKIQIEAKVKEIEKKIEDTKPLLALGLSLERYKPYKNISVFLGRVKDTEPLSGLNQLERTEYIAGENTVAVFTARPQEATKILSEAGFTELKPPATTGKPQEVLQELENEKGALLQKLKELNEELTDFINRNIDIIAAAEEFLAIEVQKSEAPLYFATTKNSFIIDGWMPAKKFKQIKELIEKETKGHVHVERILIESEDDVPIYLDNPKSMKPFELFVSAFSVPKYNELDPTILIFFTFPLFYAVMLGDIGYGAVIFAITLMPQFKTIASKLGASGAINSIKKILQNAALLSILFGFAFAEAFGLELHFSAVDLFGVHFPIHRFESIAMLLTLVLWVGILHIFLGLLIGFRNELVKHGLKHAIEAKASWMLILFGGINLVQNFMGGGSLVVGGAVTLAGIVLLLLGEGMMGIVELPTLLSNVFSYSRLLAVGLSGAGIALAFNTMSEKLFAANSIPLTVLAVIVLAIGHTLNIALGVLGPGLHALRLHYVEFFNKFYEGGGVTYQPFGYQRKYLEEIKWSH